MTTPPFLLEKRLVGFLDLLGFSQQLESRDPFEVHAQYAELIDAINRRVFDSRDHEGKRTDNFAVARFMFDSLVVVSQPTEGERGCHNMFNFLSGIIDLFQESFGARAPMRGCVTVGDFLYDQERGIFVSPQWPELVREEKSFEWAGITLLPSAAELILNEIGRPAQSIPLDAGNLLVEHDAPVKGGIAKRCWCLNWAYTCQEPWLAAGLEFLNNEKRPGTEHFVEAVRAMPAVSKSLPVPSGLRPVVEVRLQLSLCGLRIQCLDAERRAVDPPDGAKFVFHLIDARRANPM